MYAKRRDARPGRLWPGARLLAAGLPLAAGVLLATTDVRARDLTAAEIDTMFQLAEKDGRVGLARKTRPVDARPAIPAEVVVTIIRGEGEETRSKPSEPGDMVVRNRCPETGNEEILVKKEKFSERYDGPHSGSAEAPWQAYRPRGVEMRFFHVSEAWGAFTFTAPWGSPMVARPGDAIVRDPADPRDTYRIGAASFACTYEITRKPFAN